MSEPIALGTEGHLGCPTCGHARFESIQGVTLYASQTVTGEYPDGELDADRFDVIARSGHDSFDDADEGDIEPDKRCVECNDIYDTPAWCPEVPVQEELADVLGLDLLDVEACKPVAASLEHAGAVTVSEEPHATVITISPTSERRSLGTDAWKVERCTNCGGDMSEAHAKLDEVRAHDERVLDRRHLPLLVARQVCASCQ